MYDTSISKICIILSIVYHIYIYIKIINIILLNFEYWDIFFILKNDKNLDFPIKNKYYCFEKKGF